MKFKSNFSLFPSMRGWFDEMTSMSPWWTPMQSMQQFFMNQMVNVHEETDRYEIDIAAPGLKKEDFNVQINGRTLTISAEQQSDHTGDDNYHRREFNYRSFTRSFMLPEMLDTNSVEAKYEDGILHVMLRKLTNMDMENSRKIAVM